MSRRDLLGPPLGVPSDAARRASDVVNLALLADPTGNTGRWMAIRLSDGTSDGTVYDRPEHAANAQLHYQQCMYVRISPWGMPPREAHAALTYHRMCYDAGNRPPYLDGFVPVVPNSPEVLLYDRASFRRYRHWIGRPR